MPWFLLGLALGPANFRLLVQLQHIDALSTVARRIEVKWLVDMATASGCSAFRVARNEPLKKSSRVQAGT